MTAAKEDRLIKALRAWHKKDVGSNRISGEDAALYFTLKVRATDKTSAGLMDICDRDWGTFLDLLRRRGVVE